MEASSLKKHFEEEFKSLFPDSNLDEQFDGNREELIIKLIEKSYDEYGKSHDRYIMTLEID